MELLETFQLNATLVKAAAVSYEGYALALLKRETENKQFIINVAQAASCQLIAASYWSLLDFSRAHKMFGYASETYLLTRSSIGPVLAICAQDQRMAFKYLRRFTDVKEEILSPNSSLALILLQAWMAESPREVSKEVRDRAIQLESARAGRLYLPLRLYLRPVVAALDGDTATARQRGDIISSTRELLNRVADIIRVAMLDKHHWQQLYRLILPIEAEVIATICVISQRIQRAGVVADDLWRQIADDRLDPIGCAYLEIAAKLAEYS